MPWPVGENSSTLDAVLPALRTFSFTWLGDDAAAYAVEFLLVSGIERLGRCLELRFGRAGGVGAGGHALLSGKGRDGQEQGGKDQ